MVRDPPGGGDSHGALCAARVNVNVDFYSGVVYHLLGIERDLFLSDLRHRPCAGLGGAGAGAAREQYPAASAHFVQWTCRTRLCPARSTRLIQTTRH